MTTQQQMADDQNKARQMAMSPEERFIDAQDMMMHYICQYESIKFDAYKAPEGNYTIGFGNITHPDGRQVRPGDKINEAQCVEYFTAYQMEKTWPNMEKYLDVSKMTEADMVAVASLCWNCGSGILGKKGKPSELAEKLNYYFSHRDDQDARNAVHDEFYKRRFYKDKKTQKRVESMAMLQRRELECAVLFGEMTIGMGPNIIGAENYLDLSTVTLGAFNGNPARQMRTSYDRNIGFHTPEAVRDSTNNINNVRGLNFQQSMDYEKNKQNRPTPRNKRRGGR